MRVCVGVCARKQVCTRAQNINKYIVCVLRLLTKQHKVCVCERERAREGASVRHGGLFHGIRFVCVHARAHAGFICAPFVDETIQIACVLRGRARESESVSQRFVI